MNRVVVVGVGAMGAALISAAKSKFPTIEIAVIEKDPAKLLTATQSLGVLVADEQTISAAELIVLAVKPQDAAAVLSELKPLLTSDQTLLSIAAGVSLSTLTSATAATAVRCMPNTPAMIGRGFNTISVLENSDAIHLSRAENFLSSAGVTITIPESLQNTFTAIHGSGPAYVFLLIEAMVAAAVKEGISEKDATAAVIETVAGAAELIRQTGESAATLRERVTSPGGTTAAALSVFNQGGFSQLVSDAIAAAKQRAAELG